MFQGDRVYLTCDGLLASTALLGHNGFVTVDTKDLVLMFSEARARQWLGAGTTDETMAVPRLLLVVHSSCSYRLKKQIRGERS